MPYRIFRTVVTVSLLLALAVAGHAAGASENLTYELTWAGVKIGASAVRTTATAAGTEITSTVKSASWTAPFYGVDDTETSHLVPVGAGMELATYKQQIHEGKNDWYRAISVDRKGKKYRFANLHTGEKSYQKLADPAWDPVSSLYQIRRLPLVVGKTVHLNVLDSWKINRVAVRVLRRETVTTPAGTFRTIVVSPEMNIENPGLFYAPGPLTIWLTDDARKVPVIIEKRIDNLFRTGVPDYLKPLVPASVWSNTAKVETIRAVLTAGAR